MKLLIFSDIHNDWRALERLMDIEADYYMAAGDLVNFRRGLDDAGRILSRRGDRVWVLPGNHESESDIAGMCERHGLRRFHGETLEIGGYTVAGLGYSNRTPFDTPGEYTEEQLESRLAAFGGKKPLILVCHCPPKNTKLDRAGEGRHFGSAAIRAFIEREQPARFFCGHIHEAWGEEDRIGESVGRNVGKKGYLLNLGTI